MKISVVIPAYNAATSIIRALDSCMQQSVPPHEILVVNDASTDNTLEILQSYKGKLQIINQPVNAGPADARNAGWDAATGDIIAFLDADDTWHPDKLKILSGLFLENQEIYFLGHPYTLSEFGPVTMAIYPEEKPYFSILLSNPFQSSCIAVRSTLPERFTNGMRYCEDHEFAMRVAYSKGCYILPLPLTRLGRPQLTAGGASANTWKMRKGELKAYSLLWRHNPLFIIFIPLLWLFSLAKHCAKLIKTAIARS